MEKELNINMTVKQVVELLEVMDKPHTINVYVIPDKEDDNVKCVSCNSVINKNDSFVTVYVNDGIRFNECIKCVSENKSNIRKNINTF